ncbi:MAG: MscL family protein [Bacillales bacterium]|nr:MscL family protein [Erysipelotrichaceae bacterium]MDD6249875.1 MscL family protein [Bacillales bacterium]MDY3890561.1 MscL family protein [Bacilli bacterium]
MKKFFAEFKKFISRGNVMDMAVGTIVGAAFTAIVTALSNGILKPIINTIIYYLCGGNADALNKMYTPLVKVWVLDEAGNATNVLDMTKSIYIDWGAFISAIINFLLVAIVLFCIVKAFNKVKDANEAMSNKVKRIEFKVEKGIKLRKKEQEFYDAYKAQKEEEAKKAQEEASKPAPLSVSEELLTEIRDLLRNQK